MQTALYSYSSLEVDNSDSITESPSLLLQSYIWIYSNMSIAHVALQPF